jgi:hypothetical protein
MTGKNEEQAGKAEEINNPTKSQKETRTKKSIEHYCNLQVHNGAGCEHYSFDDVCIPLKVKEPKIQLPSRQPGRSTCVATGEFARVIPMDDRLKCVAAAINAETNLELVGSAA